MLITSWVQIAGVVGSSLVFPSFLFTMDKYTEKKSSWSEGGSTGWINTIVRNNENVGKALIACLRKMVWFCELFEVRSTRREVTQRILPKGGGDWINPGRLHFLLQRARASRRTSSSAPWIQTSPCGKSTTLWPICKFRERPGWVTWKNGSPCTTWEWLLQRGRQSYTLGRWSCWMLSRSSCCRNSIPKNFILKFRRFIYWKPLNIASKNVKVTWILLIRANSDLILVEKAAKTFTYCCKWRKACKKSFKTLVSHQILADYFEVS